MSGAVTGLLAGQSVALQNNGADSITVTANGTFTFPVKAASGTHYEVTISAQPSGEVCTVMAGSGVIPNANVTTVRVECAATFTVGGNVTGLLPGNSVTLQNNGTASLSVSANGAFAFTERVNSGGAYNVTVTTQPARQQCTVSAGSGTVQTNVSDVHVDCVVTAYTVSGTVSPLAPGASIELTTNGTDAILVSASGSFTFPTPLAPGSPYVVEIRTQPLYQFCEVRSGNGMIASSDVTNVVVHCPIVETQWSFGIGLDGVLPEEAPIRASDGNLYGTTQFFGPNLAGAVYKITPAGEETVIGGFEGTSANRPIAGVIQAVDGNFYGTTYSGGTHDQGTVFRLTPSGTTTVLWSFGAALDGARPKARVTQGTDGNFYGTTLMGGQHNGGTVFRLTPAGVETILWSFGGAGDGIYPEAELIEGASGIFYGTTTSGGVHSFGTIFRITSAGTKTTLHDFDFNTGSLPQALIKGADGNFYGIATGGGTTSGGTAFRLTPAGTVSVLWNFGTGTDGSGPRKRLAQGSDGNFYGTTWGGGTLNSSGTVFKLTPQGAETVLWSFGYGENGTSLPAGIVEGSDGNFYVITQSGGATGGGRLLKLIP